MLLPQPARDPVAGDDQIGVRKLGEILDLALEPNAHTESQCARGEDLEEVPAADSVPVPRHVDRLPPVDGEKLTIPPERVVR